MKPVMSIVVATSNRAKLAETRALLGELPVEVLSASEALGEEPHVVEDGDSFESNALKRARAVASASMMERLRERPGAKGLVTGTGWYLTKHAIGVYSTQPPDPDRGAEPVRPREHSEPSVAVALEAEGPATIETYTLTRADALPFLNDDLPRLTSFYGIGGIHRDFHVATFKRRTVEVPVHRQPSPLDLEAPVEPGGVALLPNAHPRAS